MQVNLEQLLLIITTHNEIKIQNEDQILFIGPPTVAFESLSKELLAEEVMSVKATALKKMLIQIWYIITMVFFMLTLMAKSIFTKAMLA